MRADCCRGGPQAVPARRQRADVDLRGRCCRAGHFAGREHPADGRPAAQPRARTRSCRAPSAAPAPAPVQEAQPPVAPPAPPAETIKAPVPVVQEPRRSRRRAQVFVEQAPAPQAPAPAPPPAAPPPAPGRRRPRRFPCATPVPYIPPPVYNPPVYNPYLPPPVYYPRPRPWTPPWQQPVPQQPPQQEPPDDPPQQTRRPGSSRDPAERSGSGGSGQYPGSGGLPGSAVGSVSRFGWIWRLVRRQRRRLGRLLPDLLQRRSAGTSGAGDHHSSPAVGLPLSVA